MDPTWWTQWGWQTWATAATIAAAVWALAREWSTPDVVLPSAVAVLIAAGILPADLALAGFSNMGLLAIAALFIVAQAVQETGGVGALAHALLGTTRNLYAVYARLVGGVTVISAFLNNTPVVLMFIPALRSWARRHDVPLSKLLIPLSYASILGGFCTLVGTATNLVVSGMMTDMGSAPIGMFEISKIGIPAAVVGSLYLIAIGHRLLPAREDLSLRLTEEARQYLVDMRVDPSCPLVGKTVEQAGLRSLKGLFLVHIERLGHIIGPVNPSMVIQAEDRLRFTGLVSTIVELKSIRGLVPVEDDSHHVKPRGELRLFEVVVAPGSPLVGLSIRDAAFRSRYEAAVIAVHRAGERIHAKIGDIVLHPGDTLMLEAPEDFAQRWYNSTHFYLVSQVGDVGRVKHEKSALTLWIVMGMIAAAAWGWLPMAAAAWCAALLLVWSRVISPASAKRAINLSVIIVIASGLALGHAIERTGLAAAAAHLVTSLTAAWGPMAVLAALMLLTNAATEVVTNKASAAMFFPVAMAAAEQMGIGADSPQLRAFQLSMALAAAASFATPLGYQTNLIVYGPGGYKYSDFLKVGIPLNLLVLAAGIGACWWWYF